MHLTSHFLRREYLKKECHILFKFFGQDLTKIDGLVEAIAYYLDEINEKGMRKTIEDEFN